MTMESSHLFRVADHNLLIKFTDSSDNRTGCSDNSADCQDNRTGNRGYGIDLLPSLRPFAVDGEAGDDLLFTLTVHERLQPVREYEPVRTFDTGNGDTAVHRLGNGGYQFVIKDLHGGSCCLLQTDAAFARCACALNGTRSMKQFGLNNALMLVFAFAASKHSTILMHASCVAHGGCAYPFIAKSGTGKSTHSNLWLSCIEGTELVNDDNPIIRMNGREAVLYGSPWSGKTPCYRNVKFPLGALTRIDRAQKNSIERLQPVQAFASILPSCSSMKWDSAIYNNLLDTITALIETVPIYTLHCLPDREAAELCHKTISGQAR